MGYPTKIAVFMQNLAVGGVIRRVTRTAKFFLEYGCTVDFVILCREQCHESQVPAEIRVVRLGATRAATSVLSCVRYLRRERPDAVLSLSTHVNIVTVAASKLAGVPTRIVLNEVNPPASERRWLNLSYSNRMMYRLLPYAYRRADRVVPNAHFVAKQLTETFGLPPDLVHVIYNPVVSSDLIRESMQTIDHPWFLKRQGPLIMGVGRLAYQKGFDVLIRALAKLRPSQPEARLILVGDGPDRRDLEILVDNLHLRDVVDFVGFQDVAVAWIAKADLLVLPSRYEGLPNVLIEALAVGTPVTATTCPGGSREVLDDGRYGSLVSPDDVDSLANAIQDSLIAPPSPELLQQRAKLFDVRVRAKEYLDVLLGRYESSEDSVEELS